MTTQIVDLKVASKLPIFDPEKHRQAAIRGVRLAAARALQKITTQIIPSRVPPPVDRGVYRASWKTQIINDGAEVYSDAPHAAFIEYGVRAENIKPGLAMRKALTEWVLRKGIASTETKARKTAHAIIEAMKRSGIFNRPPYGKGLGVMRELVEKHLTEIIRVEVEREISKLGGGA